MMRFLDSHVIGLCGALALACGSSSNTSGKATPPSAPPVTSAPDNEVAHPATSGDPGTRVHAPVRDRTRGPLVAQRAPSERDDEPSAMDRTVGERPIVAMVQLKLTNTKRKSRNAGKVKFVQRGKMVSITGIFQNLPPGKHGLHVRVDGKCGRYGAHFNPTKAKHGPPSSPQRHVGDFGNIMVQKDRTAKFKMNTDSLTVAKGHSTVVGKALVITRNPDNGKSQPSGNAGPAIACGKIQLQPSGDATPLVLR